MIRVCESENIEFILKNKSTGVIIVIELKRLDDNAILFLKQFNWKVLASVPPIPKDYIK